MQSPDFADCCLNPLDIANRANIPIFFITPSYSENRMSYATEELENLAKQFKVEIIKIPSLSHRRKIYFELIKKYL